MAGTTGAYEGLLAETVSIRGANDDPVNAYFARPLGPGPFPGVVLFHHAPGWDEWYREATRRFAHHGYLALSPNLYSRLGDGDPDDVAARARSEGGVPDDDVVGDAAASIRYLRDLPTATGKVGLFGTCSGARHAYLTACRLANVDAVVNCWGGHVVAAPEDATDKRPVAPVELTTDLPCPVLGLFGNDDPQPAPSDVDALEAALDAHGKTYEFHRYDGAGHGFFYYDRPSAYRAAAAVDGWEKVWAFLGRHLS